MGNKKKRAITIPFSSVFAVSKSLSSCFISCVWTTCAVTLTQTYTPASVPAPALLLRKSQRENPHPKRGKTRRRRSGSSTPPLFPGGSWPVRREGLRAEVSEPRDIPSFLCTLHGRPPKFSLALWKAHFFFCRRCSLLCFRLLVPAR